MTQANIQAKFQVNAYEKSNIMCSFKIMRSEQAKKGI